MVASLIRKGAQFQLEAMLAEASTRLDGASTMDAKFSFQRQDVSHLRSFFSYILSAKEAAQQAAPGGQLAADDPLSLVPLLDVRNTIEMQRELYHLYSADQQALAQLLVSFVKHGRKQKNQGQEELFPTKTLEHKVRRLTTFIRFGFVQEFPDRQSECTSINLLDKHDAVWGKLYQAIFGAGGPSSAAAKRKLSIEPDDQPCGKRIRSPTSDGEVQRLVDMRVLSLDYPTGLQNWAIEVLRSHGVRTVDELAGLQLGHIMHRVDHASGLGCYMVQVGTSPTRSIAVWQTRPGPGGLRDVSDAYSPYQVLRTFLARLPEGAAQVMLRPNDAYAYYSMSGKWFQALPISRQLLARRIEAMYTPEAAPSLAPLRHAINGHQEVLMPPGLAMPPSVPGLPAMGQQQQQQVQQQLTGAEALLLSHHHHQQQQQVQLLGVAHSVSEQDLAALGMAAAGANGISPDISALLSGRPLLVAAPSRDLQSGIATLVATVQRLLTLLAPCLDSLGSQPADAMSLQVQLMLSAAESAEEAAASYAQRVGVSAAAAAAVSSASASAAGMVKADEAEGLASIMAVLQGVTQLVRGRLSVVLQAHQHQQQAQQLAGYLGEGRADGDAGQQQVGLGARQLLSTLASEVPVLQEMLASIKVVPAVAGVASADASNDAGTAAALEEPVEALMMLGQSGSPRKGGGHSGTHGQPAAAAAQQPQRVPRIALAPSGGIPSMQPTSPFSTVAMAPAAVARRPSSSSLGNGVVLPNQTTSSSGAAATQRLRHGSPSTPPAAPQGLQESSLLQQHLQLQQQQQVLSGMQAAMAAGMGPKPVASHLQQQQQQAGVAITNSTVQLMQAVPLEDGGQVMLRHAAHNGMQAGVSGQQPQQQQTMLFAGQNGSAPGGMPFVLLDYSQMAAAQQQMQVQMQMQSQQAAAQMVRPAMQMGPHTGFQLQYGSAGPYMTTAPGPHPGYPQQQPQHQQHQHLLDASQQHQHQQFMLSGAQSQLLQQLSRPAAAGQHMPQPIMSLRLA